MDRTELIEVRDRLRAERAEVEAQLAELRQRKSSLDSVVEGLDGLIGDAEPSTDEAGKVQQPRSATSYPRGSEAVRVVLQESGTKMTVREITDAILDRGWTPKSKNPENATSSAAGRAAEVFGDVHRERGAGGAYVYWYSPETEGPPASTEPHDPPTEATIPTAPIERPWVPPSGPMDIEGGG